MIGKRRSFTGRSTASMLSFSLLSLLAFQDVAFARPRAQQNPANDADVSASSVSQSVPGTASGSGISPATSGGGTIRTSIQQQLNVTTQFYQFEDGVQPENVKQRPGGQLLVTINSLPELFQIDPNVQQMGKSIWTFPGYTSLFGIVESQANGDGNDIFYLIANNFTGAPDYYGIPGTNSIFRVNLQNIPDPTSAQGKSKIKVDKIIDIPEAQLLDGLTNLKGGNDLLVAGDAQTGTLWLIDTMAAKATPLYQGPELQGTSDKRADSLAHIGVNGVKYNDHLQDNQLYFTNTAKGTLNKIGVDPMTGKQTSPLVLVEDLHVNTYLDDFSFDSAGNAYICEPLKGVRFRRASPGPVGENSVPLVATFNANSNTFGRLPEDQCILYTTFNGRPSGKDPPGLAKIDTRALGFCGKQAEFVSAASAD